ncbi:zf-HC2 domain-containing protein [Pendulispora brunnea]|uniref:Zf-HC2 domain-containing protein n=1 Tax=Pendulispora brunnea TaxID=2905690 RepID=A0ABZ2K1N3_9BACT
MSTPCDITELELQALADGELAPEPARALEEHARTCTRCSAFLEEERALAARVGALPRAIEPAPEVWRAIESRIEGPRVLKGHARWRIAAGGFALAAAAALAIVASRPATKMPPQQTVASVPAPPSPPSPPPARPSIPENLPEEAPYLAALATLEADFAKGKHALPEATARSVEENLRTIDTAIVTVRTTLENSPDDLDLKSQLSDLYQQKIRVETDVIDLTARI